MRTRVRLASILGLTLLLPNCTSVVGLGIVAGVTGAAVLASDCSDFIDITVRDVSGSRTCEATVTATRNDEQEQIMPCYHARLGDGAWQIRASLPGRADAVTALTIKREGKCGRTVQSVELWLQPLGYAPVVATPLAPSAPPSLPAPPPAPPATQSAPTASPSTQTAPPPTPPVSAAPTPTPTPPPPPAPPGAGPVKRFPDAAPRGK